MSVEQKNPVSTTVEKKPLRPVLLISEKALYEYLPFLQHLLAGLGDQSVHSVLVCRPGCDVGTVVSPLTDVVRHPVFDLPLMGRHNRKILAEQLEKFRPTVLHCLCESQAHLTRHLAKQMNLPYVLMVCSLRKRNAELPVSPSHCAKIIVPAKSIATNIAQLYPALADRIRQINIGAFIPENAGRLGKKKRLACMVTAHPFNRADDFVSLFNAVRHLVIDGYEFLLVVMGEGRAESELRRLLRTLGLLWVVTIVPTLNVWRSIIAAGDIFIRPRATASFNPFLLEAMGAGAAVAACTGGVDDLLMEGRTCVVFNPDDELSIYHSLQKLFDKPEFARELGSQAQRYLRENHSVSEMVADIVQTYLDAEQWYRR